MPETLATFVSDGLLVITVPEASLPPPERDRFVSAVRSEWLARQSQMTDADAKRMAEEIDAGWWQKNRARILGAIGEV